MELKIGNKTISFNGDTLLISLLYVILGAVFAFLVGAIAYLAWIERAWWLPIGIIIIAILTILVYPYVRDKVE